MKYEAVIGLEVHAQLLTSTKIFCGCPNSFTTDNNRHICPVCSGMPGVLPVLNEKAVKLAVLMGFATGCTIKQNSVFARKNYFYPDLPKAYQISQYDKPICSSGTIEIATPDGGKRIIRLNRIHLEEDAGKSIHDKSPTETFVDYNRCGTPLIEIVTEPDLRTPADAAAYLTKIRQMVRYLDVCDGNMEEGSLRCDANVSIRPVGQEKLGTKTELKNMNSIKQVEKAIQFEIDRQIEVLSTGGTIIQQTLLWDPDTAETRPMRSKEDAHDYRYFPDPDLMPIALQQSWIDSVKAELIELPDAKRERFVNEYALPQYDAEVLSEDRNVADYYEKVVKAHKNPKAASNWMMTEVLRLNGKVKFPPEQLAALIKLIDDGIISGKIAKTVFEEMAESGATPSSIVESKGLVQVTDVSTIQPLIEKIVADNPSQVAEYRAGKKKVLGFFVGEAMKASRGKANPKIVNEILDKLLA
jgi:aspartyl-tRNA(Asn)/glutamyl-tRNA(Gln) amidotransferase subunit B